VTKSGAVLLSLLLACSPAIAKAISKYPRVNVIAPTPRPAPAVTQTPEPVIDLSHALPGKALAKLPSSAQQLKSLSSELTQGAPQLASAKERSDSLAAEAASLRKKLIATAARIEDLEQQKVDADAQIVRLTAEDASLSAGFARDRVAVTKLLAVLERLQHDMPPALAMRPDDALGAARGAMLIGASLPPVYAQAASLSRRIDTLKRTRLALEQQLAQAADTAARLNVARSQLDELLAQKEQAGGWGRGNLRNPENAAGDGRPPGRRFPGAAGPGQGAAPERRREFGRNPGSERGYGFRRKHRFPWRSGQEFPAGAGGRLGGGVQGKRHFGPFLCNPAGGPGDRAGRWQGSLCRPLP